jgi:hypothetical protein
MDSIGTERPYFNRALARLVAPLLGTLLLLAAAAVTAAELWYEDNNLGRHGQMPADFVSKFQQPEAFSQASRYIRVYMFHARVLERQDDAFLRETLIPWLEKHSVKLAIDAVGATWTQDRARVKVRGREINLLERIRKLGGRVDYISLQSVLSKPLRRDGKVQDYPLDKRIEDVIAYAKAARAVFPSAEIGIIDALPSHGKDYRQPYRRLRDAMAREGLGLAYIHLDMPFEYPAERINGVSWRSARAVERYVEEDLGLQFGLLATSKTGGTLSSRAFHERVMATLECYMGITGTPRDLVIASWFPHPRSTIPETATGEDYPAMRTVLEFGRSLERIRNAGPAWARHRSREPEWRALCIT